MRHLSASAMSLSRCHPRARASARARPLSASPLDSSASSAAREQSVALCRLWCSLCFSCWRVREVQDRVTAGTGSETLEAAFVCGCNRIPEAQSQKRQQGAVNVAKVKITTQQASPIFPCLGPLSSMNVSNDLCRHRSCCFYMLSC